MLESVLFIVMRNFLGMTGFVDRAVEELRETAIRTGPDQQKARDALGLLIRLLQSKGGQA